MNSGGWELALQILMTLGIGGALAPLISALSNRRKIKAEADHSTASTSEAFARATTEFTKNYQTFNADILTQLDAARKETNDCKVELISANQRIRELERKLDMAIGMLERLGQDVTVVRYT